MQGLWVLLYVKLITGTFNMIDKLKCDEFLETEYLIREWSYSSLSAFEECPLSWYNTYINKRRSPNYFAYRGSSVHECMEDYYKFVMGGGDISIDVARDTLVKKWKQKMKSCPPADVHNFTKKEAKIIDSFAYWTPLENVSAVERELKWEMGGFNFVGYVDVEVRGEILVKDPRGFKTVNGLHIFDYKGDLNIAKHIRQQRLYAVAYEALGERVDSMNIISYANRYEYVSDLNEAQGGLMKKTKNWALKQLREIKVALETGEFPMKEKKDFHCSFLCSHHLCKIHNNK